MKVCLISFDSTYFDHYIVIELKKKNIDACHIDPSKFKYKYTSIFDKICNSFNKLIFKKNKKIKKLEENILNQLKKLGHQDTIMVIRPDRISKKTHIEIKKQTNKYITYIYDSSMRFPINHLLDGVFDKIFSFDLNDTRKYHFSFIPNYIYIDKTEIKPNNGNIFIVISVDERFDFLNKIANYFSERNINFKFVAVGKKIPKNTNSNIIFSKKTLHPKDLKNDLENSKIFLDLIRKEHIGLSFRIFEALALQKKIITSNQSIKNYDFYNPNNIMVINEDNFQIEESFFTKPYEPIDESIYNKYTVQNWVSTVFGID